MIFYQIKYNLSIIMMRYIFTINIYSKQLENNYNNQFNININGISYTNNLVKEYE